MGGIDSVEETLAAPRSDGENPEVELVNEVVLHERAVKFAGAKLQDAPAGLLLQASHLAGDVTADERCIPLGLLHSRRGDVLGKAVDPVGLFITRSGRPSLRESFIGLAP